MKQRSDYKSPPRDSRARHAIFTLSLSLFVCFGLLSSDSHLSLSYGVLVLNVCFFVSTVFTPKVMGVAIARYDFSSRDTRELTLQEGDVVKIYSKTGANGWWRGEVNGRVSVEYKLSTVL